MASKTYFEQAKETLEYNRKRSKILAKIAEREHRAEDEIAKLRAELERLDREYKNTIEMREKNEGAIDKRFS